MLHYAIMASQVINLKKNIKEPENGTRNHEKPLISWSAYEYPQRILGRNWFLVPGGVATILIIIGILSKSYFFIALVILAFLVLLLYAKRGPEKIRTEINSRGVIINKEFYAYARLRSFWIFDKTLEHRLSLETSGFVQPFLLIPLGDADTNRIRDILLKEIPEKEHREFLTDQIMRRLGI